MRAHYSKELTFALARCAEAQEIPVQHATFQSFVSDGLEWLQQGHPTAMVAFPCRYTHSPHETVQESALELTVDLVAAAFLTTAPD